MKKGTLFLFAALACCGDPAAVPCEDAKEGDPCGANFQVCGPLDGYGCTKTCSGGGTWRISCNNPPTCETSTIAQGARCDPFVPLTCGPFQVDSLCGTASVTAQCSGVGWAYDLPCDPDCESLGQAECGTHKGCAWAVPCDLPTLPPVAPRCIDFPPPVGVCDSITCPAGTRCVQVGLNPGDLSSGDCSGSGTLAGFCDPE